MTSHIAMVIACPYYHLTEVFIAYERSVDISDISSEVELILARASTFSFPRNISTWTV